jgi:hypothetical protein
MKKIIYFIFLASLVLSSCEKLDENPRSNISADQFYKTTADANSAVTAVYNDLTHNTSGDHASIYNRLLVLAVGMSTDDHIAGPRATNPDVRSIAALTQSSTNTRYYELWRQHYEGINRANAAIDRIPLIIGDTLVLNRLVREARFLRALYYYNLVRLWGDVPLIVHENTSLTGLDVSRTPAEEVYAQIIEDFTEAEKLPVKYTGSDAFRATSGAAKSLLVSVYVTRKEWDKAKAKYNEIVSGPYGYDLFANYADIFSVAKEHSKEHIFDAEYAADGTVTLNGTGNTDILGIIALPISINGADADAPHPSLYPLFKPTDKRRDITFVHDSILSPFDNIWKPLPAPHFRKFWDPASGKQLANSGINIPIIRFAEVLLFYAEAVNETQGPVSEAYVAIDSVRHRAGLPGLTKGLTQDQFRDSLYFERRLEFVYEQIRWFDLIRTKRLVSEVGKLGDKANVSEKNYLLPVPASELSVNPNLTQNPGW